MTIPTGLPAFVVTATVPTLFLIISLVASRADGLDSMVIDTIFFGTLFR